MAVAAGQICLASTSGSALSFPCRRPARRAAAPCAALAPAQGTRHFLARGMPSALRVAPRPSVPRRTADPRQGVARASESSQEAKEGEKPPFGYTRKDVIGIGLGLTIFGFGLRYGLEAAGLDEFQSGNVVQLVMVLGLCLGWVSTYLWRVGNKEMTYAQQLRDYEAAVMEKRLEALSETELEAMLAEVEEEKERLRAKKAQKE